MERVKVHKQMERRRIVTEVMTMRGYCGCNTLGSSIT
jgi:hypothetical protein